MANPLGTLPQANIGLPSRRGRTQQQPGAQGAPQSPSQPPPMPGQPQTFSQMQQAGMARPAPPQVQGPPPQQQSVPSQLQGAVSHALTTPSPFNSATFNTLRDSATADLNNKYAGLRQQTDENLARRGLAASSGDIGAQHAYYDLGAAQSRDMADLNSQLLGQAATTQGQYEQGAISGAQNYQNAQNANQLGVAGLTGQYGGQSTLGAQQLAQQGSQFGQTFGLSQQQQDLAKQLGLGGLGIQQQQANTSQSGVLGQLGLGQQQLQQQGSQFGQTLGLSQQQQDLAKQLGLGGLGIQQGQLDLSKTLGQGNLALNQAQLAQQGSQFDKSQSQQASQFGQQFGLSQQQQDLAKQLGLGNLGLNQAQLAQQNDQFNKNQSLQGSQFSIAQQHAQDVAKMQDATANRQVDATYNQAQNNFLLQLASALGISPDVLKGITGGTTGTSGGTGVKKPDTTGGATDGGVGTGGLNPTDSLTGGGYSHGGITSDSAQMDPQLMERLRQMLAGG